MPQQRGKIVWFSASKGFGFIKREAGEDVFCAHNAVSPADSLLLRDGVEVEFDVSGPEGLQAENVALVRQLVPRYGWAALRRKSGAWGWSLHRSQGSHPRLR